MRLKKIKCPNCQSLNVSRREVDRATIIDNRLTEGGTINTDIRTIEVDFERTNPFRPLTITGSISGDLDIGTDPILFTFSECIQVVYSCPNCGYTKVFERS